jgi:hypothetical protein
MLMVERAAATAQSIRGSVVTFTLAPLDGKPDMSVHTVGLPSPFEYTWRVSTVSRADTRIVVYPSDAQFQQPGGTYFVGVTSASPCSFTLRTHAVSLRQAHDDIVAATGDLYDRIRNIRELGKGLGHEGGEAGARNNDDNTDGDKSTNAFDDDDDDDDDFDGIDGDDAADPAGRYVAGDDLSEDSGADDVATDMHRSLLQSGSVSMASDIPLAAPSASHESSTTDAQQRKNRARLLHRLSRVPGPVSYTLDGGVGTGTAKLPAVATSSSMPELRAALKGTRAPRGGGGGAGGGKRRRRRRRAGAAPGDTLAKSLVALATSSSAMRLRGSAVSDTP